MSSLERTAIADLGWVNADGQAGLSWGACVSLTCGFCPASFTTVSLTVPVSRMYSNQVCG